MIIKDPKLLRGPFEPASPDEVDDIIEKLSAELERSAELGRPGIGLAAPQIGINKTVAIVRVPNGRGQSHNVNLVNCKVDKGYDRQTFNGEGCLSFPGLAVKTKRFKEIHVVDNMVAPNNFIATGLFAVAIQHELDHLDGILLPDFL
jgi:peptide deformylase